MTDRIRQRLYPALSGDWVNDRGVKINMKNNSSDPG